MFSGDIIQNMFFFYNLLVKIYSLSDIDNPLLLAKLKLGGGDADDIQAVDSENILVVGIGRLGIILVDIKDKSHPLVIGQWNDIYL